MEWQRGKRGEGNSRDPGIAQQAQDDGVALVVVRALLGRIHERC